MTAAGRNMVAVDPGKHAVGVALFDRFSLELAAAAFVKRDSVDQSLGPAAIAAATARSLAEWCAGKDVGEGAVEWPQVYAGMIRRGEMDKDPNNLLPLAGVDAAFAALFGGIRVTSYLPSEWKGQLTKDACHRRIETRLSPTELAILRAAAAAAGSELGHNVWDAVGIGLHHNGRLARRRVIATGGGGKP